MEYGRGPPNTTAYEAEKVTLTKIKVLYELVFGIPSTFSNISVAYRLSTTTEKSISYFLCLTHHDPNSIMFQSVSHLDNKYTITLSISFHQGKLG